MCPRAWTPLPSAMDKAVHNTVDKGVPTQGQIALAVLFPQQRFGYPSTGSEKPPVLQSLRVDL